MTSAIPATPRSAPWPSRKSTNATMLAQNPIKETPTSHGLDQIRIASLRPTLDSLFVSLYNPLPLLFLMHIDTQVCTPWRMFTLQRSIGGQLRTPEQRSSLRRRVSQEYPQRAQTMLRRRHHRRRQEQPLYHSDSIQRSLEVDTRNSSNNSRPGRTPYRGRDSFESPNCLSCLWGHCYRKDI
jgi:hypothetical protein